jgi:hypothetical protein
MNIKTATIVQPLDLGEYHESFAGRKLLVWVNLPRDLMDEREKIIRDGAHELAQSRLPRRAAWWNRLFAKRKGLNERMFVWLNIIWSQHEDEDCAWPLDDIRELYRADPAMYQWMVRRSVEMIAEFRASSKKK